MSEVEWVVYKKSETRRVKALIDSARVEAKRTMDEVRAKERDSPKGMKRKEGGWGQRVGEVREKGR